MNRFLLWVLLLCFITSCVECTDCKSKHFFGSNCQYKCHCENTCDESGNCTGDSRKCRDGWFGLQCQYQDIVANATVELSNRVLKSDSCNRRNNPRYLKFTWDTFQPFTWMRIKLSPKKVLHNFTLVFTYNVTNLTCKNQRIFRVESTTFDIYCDLNVPVNQLMIVGDAVSSICGGRNFALNHNTSQTSTFTSKLLFGPHLAVDGLIQNTCSSSGCSHTDTNDSNPSWILVFNEQYIINKFVLYNRVDDAKWRLKFFNLQVLDNSNTTIFNYTDTKNESMLNYTVLYLEGGLVSAVKVGTNYIEGTEYEVPFVTLNELEAFGECKPGMWGLNCTKRCDSSCSGLCVKDDGSCNLICIGFSDPPSCIKECGVGKWGINCANDCNSSCYESSCDRQNGTCLKGCLGFTNPPLCTKPCIKHSFGRNCSERCSARCFDKICNPASGVCLFCDKGYQGDFCNKRCDDTRFGQNCSQQCNNSCLDKKCHHINGTCLKCSIGKYGERCRDCPRGKYGENCAHNCSSNCKNGTTCDIEMGSCISGCKQGYEGSTCEILSGTGEIGTLVGAVIGGLVFFIIAGVIIIRCRRKRGNGKERALIHNEMKTPSEVHVSGLKLIPIEENLDNAQTFSIKNSRASEPYYNVVALNKQETSINICDLLSFLQSQTSDFFKQQFQSLPEPKNVNTDAALQDGNRTKNRFKNICPYDHSRVHLNINTENQESDYINASYIEGYNAGVKFIASQGPSSVTVKDFVRMLWEQNTEVIVMLTNLVEDGKVKCEQYWPSSDEIMLGDIKINLISTQTFADYTIRKLEMSKKGESSHHLTQFHFTSWPDKSVPTASWSLVDFEQRVFTIPSSKPIVVHCSAGVGRTGTFIALRNVMMQAEKEKKVDFYNTIIKLRQDRMFMVQTAEQFEFLHKAALAAIVCLGTAISGDEFEEKLRILDKNSKLDSEFKDICNVCKVYENSLKKQETMENVYQNATTTQVKDRFTDIIPVDLYRPHLVSGSADVGGYINALVLSSFRQKNQQIITQLPMSHTVTDFWNLVLQYNVSLIVAFELENMKSDETFGMYLPSSNDCLLTCPPFQIKSVIEIDKKLWQEQHLIVSTKKNILFSNKSKDQESYKLTHIKYKFTELDCKKLLSFITEIRLKLIADGRVLYMCRNGALYSGLACVLSLLLDKMDYDSCINIPLVVGTVKSIRPQVIPTVEQYRLIYKILQSYNQKSSGCSKSKSLPVGESLSSMRSKDCGADIYANL